VTAGAPDEQQTLDAPSVDAEPVSPSIPPGGRFCGPYSVGRLLGRGAVGEVRRAHHVETGQEVALKLIPHDGDALVTTRFFRELRLAKEIEHPGVVEVLDGGEDLEERVLYVAMELLEGRTLAEVMNDPGFDREAAMALTAQVLQPLAASHAAGVVHRDLKPENVFICDDLGGPRVKLLDFGIALRIGEERATATGVTVGTPVYMSPEQATRPKEVGPASDLWAFGVLLYEILSGGRLPYEGDTPTTVMLAIAQRDPTPLDTYVADLDPELSALVRDCLERDPSRRPVDPGEVELRLASGLASGRLGRLRTDDEASAFAEARRRREEAARSTDRRPTPALGPRLGCGALALGALVVLLAAGALFAAWGRPGPSSPPPPLPNAASASPAPEPAPATAPAQPGSAVAASPAPPLPEPPEAPERRDEGAEGEAPPAASPRRRAVRWVAPPPEPRSLPEVAAPPEPAPAPTPPAPAPAPEPAPVPAPAVAVAPAPPSETAAPEPPPEASPSSPAPEAAPEAEPRPEAPPPFSF
jgi:hypothetical protein